MKRGLLLIAFCSIFFSCAKIVAPSGGERDSLAPKVVRSLPENNSTNFKDKEFVIHFDEYIVGDNVSQNLLVSPPLRVKPQVSVRLKTLRVSGLDSLQENTTYIFDFSSSIRDFNEGNRMRGLKYSFSTGSCIDSLAIEGRLLEEFTLKPVADKYVLLFADTLLSSIYDSDCSYITKSDSLGLFSFTNIADGEYRIFALEDKNQNKRYDLPNEGYGFSEYSLRAYVLDSTVLEKRKKNVVYFQPFVEKANLDKDSLVVDSVRVDSLLVDSSKVIMDSARVIVNFEDSVFASSSHIFYLCNLRGEVVKSVVVESGKGSVVFEQVKEATYSLKCVVDENNNAKWDSMDFSQAKVGERVVGFGKLIGVKKSWDIEENWTILWD